MADPHGRLQLWDALQPELWQRIAEFMAPNEVACNLRLLNKATAAQLRTIHKVTLSQPVPHHAFAWKWGLGRCHAAQSLALGQRKQLLSLTACSGVVANMEVAVEALARLQACCLTAEVFEAAAAGGSLEMLRWLLSRGCRQGNGQAAVSAASAGHLDAMKWIIQQDVQSHWWTTFVGFGWQPPIRTRALEAAAIGGRTAVVEGLLAEGAQWDLGIVSAAVLSGNLELLMQLLQRVPPKVRKHAPRAVGLADAMRTFTLPDILQLHDALLRCYEDSTDEEDDQGQVRLGRSRRRSSADLLDNTSVANALISSTPDWRLKLEWLEGKGHRIDQKVADYVIYDVMDLPDAVERVAYMHRAGLLKSTRAMCSAVYRGNSEVLGYLVQHGLANWQACSPIAFSAGANLDMVAAALAAGIAIRAFETVLGAVTEGDLRMLRWLSASESGRDVIRDAIHEAELDEHQRARLTKMAIYSGSVEVMEWLQEQGFPLVFQTETFYHAAGLGGMPMLEWLAARGCPMGARIYLAAAINDDLSTLDYLKQLGCPWDEGTKTFTTAVVHSKPMFIQRGCSLAVLRWMYAAGCPVDLETAIKRASMRVSLAQLDPEAFGVKAWLTEEAKSRGFEVPGHPMDTCQQAGLDS